jgi:hypothetical protein
MTKQASISYISGLMDNPASLTPGDANSISTFRQSFPYFIPARYLEAVSKHRVAPFAPAMLDAAMPYIGNWMLFCDFLQAEATVTKSPVSANEIPVAEDKVPNQPATEQFEEVATELIPEPQATDVAPMAQEIPDTLQESVGKIEVTDEILPEIQAEEVVNANTTLVETVLGTANENANEVITEEVIAAADTAIPEEIESALTDELEKQHNNFWIQDEINEPDSEGTTEVELQEEVQTSGISEVQTAIPETIREIKDIPGTSTEKPLIYPVYTEDYFLQQGEKVPNELVGEIDSLKAEESKDEAARSLMVMMSFSEWLLHFKSNTEKQKEETKDRRALKTMWQKEKLAAAIEEENEEIPENVFEMAVNSIAKEDGLASESLAEIYIKQGKHDKAVDMYRKLSLRNPQKNAYFARKIEEILKEK